MKNELYWECDACGNRTPRHALTKQEDMPKCHKSLNTPKIIEYDRFYKPVYQNNCNGSYIAK